MIPTERLEEILAKATKARDWEASDLYDDTCSQCEKEGTSEWGILGIDGGYHAQFGDKDQAAFIASSTPATVSSIITELLALRARSSLLDVAVEALRKIAKSAGEIGERGTSGSGQADCIATARTAIQAITASSDTGDQ